MKLKKTLSSLVIGSSALAAALFSSTAFASATVPGSACQIAVDFVTGAGNDGAIQYSNGKAFAVGGINIFNCPISNGSSNGSIARFRINVTDESAQNNIQCRGVGLNTSTGGNVFTTPWVFSSGQFVTQTLTTQAAIPSGTPSTNIAYFAECSVPGVEGFGVISSVNSIHLD